MPELTQKERVLRKLLEEGVVSNFWAIENYILRLGAIIHGLRQDGYEIDGKFGRDLGLPRSQWKNYFYTMATQPKVDKF